MRKELSLARKFFTTKSSKEREKEQTLGVSSSRALVLQPGAGVKRDEHTMVAPFPLCI